MATNVPVDKTNLINLINHYYILWECYYTRKKTTVLREWHLDLNNCYNTTVATIKLRMR